MSAIEQRARALLAAEYEADGCMQLARMIRSEDVTDPDFGSVKIMRSMRAIIAALTPPEGFVLVPVEPTESMVDQGLVAGDGHDWTGPESVWAAMIAARPEVP